jgi:endoglucanase
VSALLLGVTACGAAPRPAAAPSQGDPLAGQSFYVNPQNHAALQVAQWRAEGRTAQAAQIERIAVHPTANWLTQEVGVREEAEALTRAAAAAARSTLLVAYFIPGRDCSGYSAGGAPSAAAYRRWIGELAQGIGTSTVTVVVEPDAVLQALSGCLGSAARAQRFALLSAAVAALRRDPHATVYLDAGNVGWLRAPRTVARALRAAGVTRANGFALNVSNFYATAATIAAGERLSRLLGGAHFIIDTSRNGNGAAVAADGTPQWCNPRGRALGTAPTTHTGHRLVDAYLWVKQPGDSDGTCRPGAPPAGTWWPQYALELTSHG